MQSARQRAEIAGKKHRDENPGHVVDVSHGTDGRGPWGISSCHTCRDNATHTTAGVWLRPMSPDGVAAVRDCDGQVWRCHPNQEGSDLFHDRWVCDDPKVHVIYTWLQLLECAPLTEVE